MAVSEGALIANKFRGCMLGSLLGDCLGAPFEGEPRVAKIVLQNYFDKLCGPYFNAPVKQYTDDTAMTKSVAESLLSQNGFDALDMARRFVKEYFQQPRRGYGANVATVFAKLRNSRFSDVYAPAQEQFGGMGSYGNGGAMRVAPVALYYHGQSLSDCLAVDQCLRLSSKEPLDCNAFLDGLSAKMSHIEKDDEGLGLQKVDPYQQALNVAKTMLKEPQVLDDQIEEYLGIDISALRSTDDPLRRTLQYAISLGGDTDTIASMAGALAGAYVGSDNINQSVLKHCEASREMSELGDKLYDVIKT
ncbi:hypothetical protein B566_EDAN010855 [Ephemera danica]|nr:hypothetical protein B566_EDAN010855 [Ephemera danica]